jgi:hypothetical protein
MNGRVMDAGVMNSDRRYLATYLLFMFWWAVLVLIGAIAHLIHPSFSLWNWIFRGFPGSAFHPVTWGKEAGLVLVSFFPALLFVRSGIGLKP